MLGLHLAEIFLVEYEEAGDGSLGPMGVMFPVCKANLFLADALDILSLGGLALGLFF